MTELAQQLIEKEREIRSGYLDLGRCGLTEMPNLSDMDWLETLILSNEWWDRELLKWVNSPNLGKPNRLRALYANYFPQRLNKLVLGGESGVNWGISDVSFLGNLTNLQILDLNNSQINDVSFLGNLTNLQTLYLRSNKISDVLFWEDLMNLQTLDISNNQIYDMSFLINLTNLQTLDLSYNQIKDVSFLGNLTNLQTLDLRSNQIKDVSFLGNLDNLQTLYLRYNKISDISFLGNLTNLQTLELSYSQISDVSFLGNLTTLQTLDLSYNQISDVSFLENLTNLQILDLRSNKISDVSFLGNLTNLQTLYLNSNQISNGSFLSNLKNLQILYLNSNQISNWSFLSHLTNLQILYLSSNQISEGAFLYKLTNLQILDLSSNNISDVSFLDRLTNLQTLDLSYNKISDVPFLKNLTGKILGHHFNKLTKMTTINLMGNQISDASFLGQLTNLQKIHLSYNKISDVSFLGQLTDLQSLYLGSNQISDVSFFGNLTNLQTLSLHNNKIRDWSFLSKLTNLQTLDLRSNQIKEGSFLSKLTNLLTLNISSNIITDGSFLEKLPKLQSLDISKNSLSNPPKEISEQGNDAILNYFQQIIAQGTAPLYEARLIMVGEPGAGKTSLTEKLLDEKHEVKPDDPKKKSTLGINVKENWSFEDCRRSGDEFKAHIWDFGGQEIQYMTHQFFLTPESLYVLGADDRKQHTLFPYWFEVIRLLARDEVHGHSPVLVVLNERSNKSITNFDLNDYRLRYPDMDIQVCEVDLCESNLLRFRQLRARVQEALCYLPQAGRPLPAKWPRIREDLFVLKEQGFNYISMAKFREVCAINKVIREEDLALISLYLHRLGAILYFQQDRSLRDFMVISPTWALKAIYVVLEDKAVEKANGFFTEADLDRYWDNLTDSERDNILNMMKNESFEIVYPVTGGYIAPQLLLKVRPVFDWDSSTSLKCRFSYRFMPKGILTRLIVRKHAHIKTQEWVWARGVVLHFAGCDILVVEQDAEKDGIIQIEVQGKGRDGIRALDFVRNEIEEIHAKWFSKIDFQPMVPCDCEDCRASVEPTYFKLESLVKRLDQNRQEIECEKGEVKDVPIRRLLEGVYDTSDIASKMDRLMQRHWDPDSADDYYAQKNALNRSKMDAGGNIRVGDENIQINHNYFVSEKEQKLPLGPHKLPLDPQKDLKNTLKALLSKEKATEVIDQLLDYSEGKDNDLNNAILLLSARLNRITTRELKGIIDHAAAGIERNQINDALTILIDRL
jgi:internalin A